VGESKVRRLSRTLGGAARRNGGIRGSISEAISEKHKLNFPSLSDKGGGGKQKSVQKRPSIGGLRAAIANRAGLRSSGDRGLPKATAAASAAAAVRRRSSTKRASSAIPSNRGSTPHLRRPHPQSAPRLRGVNSVQPKGSAAMALKGRRNSHRVPQLRPSTSDAAAPRRAKKLELPHAELASHSRIKDESKICGAAGVAAVQGRRPYMEDRHIISVWDGDINADDATNIYAVFDGHGGKKCSTMLAKLAEKYLKEHPTFATDIEKCCFETFARLDEAILSKSWQDGSTGCVVLVRKGSFWCANTGDSRAVIFHNGKAKPLSKDHKPNNPAEKRRIIKGGGTVDFVLGVYRVNGCLAVARAFGDAPLKPFGLTSMPDVVKYRRTPHEEFIIIASDGLFDVMSNEEACRFVKRNLNNLANRASALGGSTLVTEQTLTTVANKLVQFALKKGSLDNITAIIVMMN